MTSTPQAMPETDWLTGLASRAAFARQVNQADRDQDAFSIAVINIDDFAEVNNQLGYEAGDDLLRAVGRALAMLTSVNTMASRLDGTRFGLFGLEVTAEEALQWARPAVAAAKAAVSDWTFDQVDFAGDCPCSPEVLTGVASGSTRRVWVEASEALDLAVAGGANAVMEYRADDPRFVARQRRNDEAAAITTALDADTLLPMAYRIDLATGGDRDWTWLRLSAGLSTDVALRPTSEIAVSTGRRLERWLVEQAGAAINQAGGLLRVTVPVAREVENGRAFAQRLFPLLERKRIPPSRILFEVSEAVLLGAGV